MIHELVDRLMELYDVNDAMCIFPYDFGWSHHWIRIRNNFSSNPDLVYFLQLGRWKSIYYGATLTLQSSVTHTLNAMRTWRGS